VATLVFIPATEETLSMPDRAGMSLSRVLDSVGQGVLSYTSRCADWGAGLAGMLPASLAGEGAPAVTPAARPQPTATGSP
jgi:hypothetical protein